MISTIVVSTWWNLDYYPVFVWSSVVDYYGYILWRITRLHLLVVSRFNPALFLILMVHKGPMHCWWWFNHAWKVAWIIADSSGNKRDMPSICVQKWCTPKMTLVLFGNHDHLVIASFGLTPPMGLPVCSWLLDITSNQNSMNIASSTTIDIT